MFISPNNCQFDSKLMNRSSTEPAATIELQGKGYPGSTYTLKYNPAYDAMVGIYFQAVIRQPFDVVFQRK